GESVRHPRVDIIGVDTYDVLPVAVPDLMAYQRVLIVGRYKTDYQTLRGRGGAVVRLSGQAARGRVVRQTNIIFPAGSEECNIATKLWAASMIETLGRNARNRRKVIFLSKRFALLSPFTSWLAVPRSERERFEAAKMRVDLEQYS